MSTADETHAARLHGEALLAALRVELQPLVDQLAEQAGGRDDLRAQCAGLIAGWWFASPATQQGHELIAVGLLLLAGPVDRDLLMHWVRVGFDRRIRSTASYDPSPSGVRHDTSVVLRGARPCCPFCSSSTRPVS